MDPMGIHTGDSITVAPAMTLSDTTYQKMRDMAIHMMRSIGDFAGGCNVQFAVSPDEKKILLLLKLIHVYLDLRLWLQKQPDILLQRLLPN